MALYPGFPLAKADYQVGTITLTNGSKNFTLNSANPLDFAAATAGDEIYIPKAGKVLLIETISNSGGTLLYKCPSDCAGANQPFHLRLKPTASRVQGMVATLLQKMGSGNLASIDELTLAENHVLAGGQVAGQVKAVNLPSQMNAKLDKSGGNMSGTLVHSNHIAARFTNNVNSPAVLFRKDGDQFDIMLTDAGGGGGNYNNLRPFRMYLDSGDVTFGHTVDFRGEVQVKSANALRFVKANNTPSVIARNDGSNFYFLLTNADSPYGSFNDLRPFHINLGTGRVAMKEGLNVDGGINIAGGLLKIINADHNKTFDATFSANGAIRGDIWGDWHASGWAKTAIDSRINAAKAECVTASRLTNFSSVPFTNSGWTHAPNGSVITGLFRSASGEVTSIGVRKLQVKIGSNWVDAS